MSSISDSLFKLFKGEKSADELLKSTAIIRQIIIGICYLDNKNPKSIPRLILGDEASHASFLFMTMEKSQKNWILVNMENINILKIKNMK